MEHYHQAEPLKSPCCCIRNTSLAQHFGNAFNSLKIQFATGCTASNRNTQHSFFLPSLSSCNNGGVRLRLAHMPWMGFLFTWSNMVSFCAARKNRPQRREGVRELAGDEKSNQLPVQFCNSLVTAIVLLSAPSSPNPLARSFADFLTLREVVPSYMPFSNCFYAVS